jgi:ABC-type multidrug transport system fused ATPase/permease subunit
MVCVKNMSESLRHEGVLQRYLRKYWYLIVISVIFATLSNTFNLRLPIFITTLVDVIITKQQFDLIPQFIVELATIFGFAGVFDLVRTLVTQYLGNNIIYNIRNEMYGALQRQSYTFYDQNRTGQLMSKTTSDINHVRVFLANEFQNLIKNVISFFVIFIFVWQLNWQISLLFLALTPPLYFLMVWYRKRIRPLSYAMYTAYGAMISTVQENIAGIRVVKAFGREKVELNKYMKQNDEYVETTRKVIKLQTIYGPMSELITMFGSTMLVFIGGFLVLSGQMTLGAIVAVFTYFSMVFDPIRNIVNFFNQWSANKAALDRVNEVLENRIDIQNLTQPLDPSRLLGDLYLRLLKDEKILTDLDNYLGIKEETDPFSGEIKTKLRKFQQSAIFPSGVKMGAVDSIGFKGNQPVILADEGNMKLVAEKVSLMVKQPKFRAELEKINEEEFKKGSEKQFDIIMFVGAFFKNLIRNNELMMQIYSEMSKHLKKEISELKANPLDILLNYIEIFPSNESELNRLVEIQKALYSPASKEEIQIAKKYQKLLKKKGVTENEVKEELLGSQSVTNDALSFLRLEKETIGKELDKARKRRTRDLGVQQEEHEPETLEEIELKIKPVQLNTSFNEICPTPVLVPNFQGHVIFQNVYFAYDTQSQEQNKWALEDILLDIKPGETVAFLGATGSGKSTLINLIPRFYEATQGRIFIDGIDIKELDLKLYRRKIGIVAQETFLFSRSIKENISYGKKKVKMEDIMTVAKIAHIHDFIMGLPDGYDTVVGERGQTLSGGQKQRVAIARALLLDPKILILDDSLSAVDVDTEYEIQQALENLFENRTTFIITQRLSTIRNCSRIFVLDDGKIIEQGSHDELIELNGIYTKIYNTMFRKQSKDKVMHIKFDKEKGFTGEFISPEASQTTEAEDGTESSKKAKKSKKISSKKTALKRRISLFQKDEEGETKNEQGSDEKSPDAKTKED